MAAPLVDHRPTQGLGQHLDTGDQFFDRPLGIFGALYRGVKVVDVGLVVLAMVDLHGLGIDVRFQRIVGIGQRRQGIRHINGLWIDERAPGATRWHRTANAVRAGIRRIPR
ncbi:hypothetical protein D9M71_97730 [compost metagenome]